MLVARLLKLFTMRTAICTNWRAAYARTSNLPLKFVPIKPSSHPAPAQACRAGKMLVAHLLKLVTDPAAPPQLLADNSLATIVADYAQGGSDVSGPVLERCRALLEGGRNTFAALRVRRCMLPCF